MPVERGQHHREGVGRNLPGSITLLQKWCSGRVVYESTRCRSLAVRSRTGRKTDGARVRDCRTSSITYIEDDLRDSTTNRCGTQRRTIATVSSTAAKGPTGGVDHRDRSKRKIYDTRQSTQRMELGSQAIRPTPDCPREMLAN